MTSASIPPFVFADAVRHFWRTRQTQARAQSERGMTDQGARAAVTGGKQMDGFVVTIGELLAAAGVNRDDIHPIQTQLPGYYRSTKQWDLVVVTEGKLSGVLELKSQVGSLSNNCNNRTEEALGSAVDLWTAYREGAFSTSPQPWLGYLLLLEDSPRARIPVRSAEPYFPVFPEFRTATYAQRYGLFCRKLVLERNYSAACFLMADPSKAGAADNYTEPAEDLSAKQFLTQLIRHVAPLR